MFVSPLWALNIQHPFFCWVVSVNRVLPMVPFTGCAVNPSLLLFVRMHLKCCGLPAVPRVYAPLQCPASTVQILGAEKALFRALKSKGNTPKYGLIFHSSFIGRAGAKNKGRVSRCVHPPG